MGSKIDSMQKQIRSAPPAAAVHAVTLAPASHVICFRELHDDAVKAKAEAKASKAAAEQLEACASCHPLPLCGAHS
jgi:hypothetical protein